MSDEPFGKFSAVDRLPTEDQTEGVDQFQGGSKSRRVASEEVDL
jgi:hypothetical protein